MIIGIDPGLSGCLVAISEITGLHCRHLHMPTTKLGKSGRVDGAAVVSWLSTFNVNHAYIERVSAMPKQGVSSTFTFGHGAGVLEGVLEARNIPYTLVAPQAWRKAAGLPSGKDASRARAIQLYPGIDDLRRKGKGQALADALFIARYGMSGGRHA